MPIDLSIRRQAFEGLLHFYPKKQIARDLGISKGSITAWNHFIEADFYDWLDKPYVGQRKELNRLAVNYWMEHYPIAYTDVARRFGIRTSGLYQALCRALAPIPVQLRPKRIRYWDVIEKSSIGAYKMSIENLSDIPADRPLKETERKALFKEIQDAKARLICAESLLEVAQADCKDELKKKEITRQLKQLRKVLASYKSVDL